MNNNIMNKIPIREQKPKNRIKNFDEVCYGYNEKEAIKEATRCMMCKNAKCISGCPINVNIPKFIKEIKNKNFKKAFMLIKKTNMLPSICGRVCPQEIQCEGRCIRGINGQSISIGKLERFVGDWALKNKISFKYYIKKNKYKIAIIGSGPAGLSCASDLAKNGYDVTIFEALHELGGVLSYGIPEFRLPKDKIVKQEIKNIKMLGIKIKTNIIIGKTITINELINENNFKAVFIASGAGLPLFTQIPGELSNGVFSANEYLTRNNLMKSFNSNYDTPIKIENKIAIIGGGNVAIDAARTALRLGSKEVHIIYRRSELELPARKEEIQHAKEEGVIFNFLCNPIEILSDNNGYVNGIKCIKMKLSDFDSSGRRRPIKILNSEFILKLNMVIIAIGTTPNLLISSTTDNLKINKKKCIIINKKNYQTTKKYVFAGGDIVTGSATVILAMKAGKEAAINIDRFLNN